jgi:hypothetical protein
MPFFPMYGLLTHQVFAHTYTHGFAPERRHRREANEFSLGTFHSFQLWLHGSGDIAGLNRFRATRGLFLGWGYRVHRLHGTAVVGVELSRTVNLAKTRRAKLLTVPFPLAAR